MIVPFSLPPHTSHVLQPLDIAVFSPIQNAYGNEVNKIPTAITKNQFPNIFCIAKNKAYTVSNIKSDFHKTGIWPLDPSQRLQNWKEPPPLPHEFPTCKAPPLTELPPPCTPPSNTMLFIDPVIPTTPHSIRTLCTEAQCNIASTVSPRTQWHQVFLEKFKNSTKKSLAEVEVTRAGEKYLRQQIMEKKKKIDTWHLKYDKQNYWCTIE